MTLTVHYLAQLRTAAGRATDSVSLNVGATVADLFSFLAEGHAPTLRSILLDQQGKPQRSVLVFRCDEQIDPADPAPLRDGDIVTLLTPIAGGAH